MASSSDKNWAAHQLIDPLIEPEPAQQDGPAGSHFGNTFAGTSDTSSSAQLPSEKKGNTSATVRPVRTNEPTPPASASPSKTAFPEYKDQGFGSTERLIPSARQSSEMPTSTAHSVVASTAGGDAPSRRRGSSLKERFPGDTSHRPLDTLRQHNNAANRHARKNSRVGADMIDQLDTIGGNGPAYHHDGPYDATLLGRNMTPQYSPVAATARTNYEALRATPAEAIADALRGHRPLSGTAIIPPGQPDRFGRVLNYNEGPNLNVEMGWRRWKGIDYHPDDIKGKGEPYFTIDRALKENKKDSSHRRVFSEGGIELAERPRSTSNPYAPSRGSRLRSASGVDAQGIARYTDEPAREMPDAAIRRANTTGKRASGMSGALGRKVGSLRRRRAPELATEEEE